MLYQTKINIFIRSILIRVSGLLGKMRSNKGLEIVVTKHALRRMRERGCDPLCLHKYLSRTRILHLKRNSRGYEAIIPFKGRLAGDFDGEKFIIKTFLTPYYNKRDYGLCVRKAQHGLDVIVAQIRVGKYP